MTRDERTPARRHLRIRGRVQGVGFRPFVTRLAHELAVAGRVGNDAQGVFVDIEAPDPVLDRFMARLQGELPPLARIHDVAVSIQSPTGAEGFHIVASRDQGELDLAITPDSAICADCRSELVDPHDRRYRYPFINCTNCGPRYSIIRSVPYDRPRTTMAGFAMCSRCRREYEDPSDRRYHAQPDACAVCGPRAWLTDATGHEVACHDPVAAAAARLTAGAILAIKGLGGFHLACRADHQEVVQRLRVDKQRAAKPFALMVRDTATARGLVDLDDEGMARLTDPAAPIVLAPRQSVTPVAAAVAPGTDLLGVMLPYTPLHHLLLADGPPILVMTSGNPAGEPLCIDNQEAHHRLGSTVDGCLLHDRPIARPIDDSVLLAARVPRR